MNYQLYSQSYAVDGRQRAAAGHYPPFPERKGNNYGSNWSQQSGNQYGSSWSQQSRNSYGSNTSQQSRNYSGSNMSQPPPPFYSAMNNANAYNSSSTYTPSSAYTPARPYTPAAQGEWSTPSIDWHQRDMEREQNINSPYRDYSANITASTYHPPSPGRGHANDVNQRGRGYDEREQDQYNVGAPSGNPSANIPASSYTPTGGQLATDQLEKEADREQHKTDDTSGVSANLTPVSTADWSTPETDQLKSDPVREHHEVSSSSTDLSGDHKSQYSRMATEASYNEGDGKTIKEKPLKKITVDESVLGGIKRSLEEEGFEGINTNLHNNSSQLKSSPLQMNKKQKNKTGPNPMKNALMYLYQYQHDTKFVLCGQSGPTHAPIFEMQVEVDGQTFKGSGTSKKIAKTKAAEIALNSLTPYLNTADGFQAKGKPYEKFVDGIPQKQSFVQDNYWDSPEGQPTDMWDPESCHEVKNPLMLLNEMRPGLEYRLEWETGQYENKEFIMAVTVDNYVYEGRARSKQHAKAKAAMFALADMYNMPPMFEPSPQPRTNRPF